MTHPLLTPRYMVEADYPNSRYTVGQVINATSDDIVAICNKYPKIFRPMHWSEGRTLDERPRWMRFIDDPGYVLKVDTYLLGKVPFNKHTVRQRIEDCTPATEAEYLEYLKSKEK